MQLVTGNKVVFQERVFTKRQWLGWAVSHSRLELRASIAKCRGSCREILCRLRTEYEFRLLVRDVADNCRANLEPSPWSLCLLLGKSGFVLCFLARNVAGFWYCGGSRQKKRVFNCILIRDSVKKQPSSGWWLISKQVSDWLSAIHLCLCFWACNCLKITDIHNLP